MTESHTPEGADAIKRGSRRLLRRLGYRSALEVPLPNGQRADILALGERGTIWIVEVKAHWADYQADSKWPSYAAYCDGLLFAVDSSFPRQHLPEGTGLIVADAFDAALVAEPPEQRLTGARRRSLTHRIARLGLERLHRLDDPWLD